MPLSQTSTHRGPHPLNFLQILFLSQLAVVTHSMQVEVPSHRNRVGERSVYKSERNVMISAHCRSPNEAISSHLVHFPQGVSRRSKSEKFKLLFPPRFQNRQPHQSHAHFARDTNCKSRSAHLYRGSRHIVSLATFSAPSVEQILRVDPKFDSGSLPVTSSTQVSASPPLAFTAAQPPFHDQSAIRSTSAPSYSSAPHDGHASSVDSSLLNYALSLPVSSDFALSSPSIRSDSKSVPWSFQITRGLFMKGIKSLSADDGSLHAAASRRLAGQRDHQEHELLIRRRAAQLSHGGDSSAPEEKKAPDPLFEGNQPIPENTANDYTGVRERAYWKSPLLERGPLITVSVAQDGGPGSADFPTIQQAIDNVPARNTQRVIIRIRAGTYREKVVVPYNKPFITFQGDESGSTLITWNDTASTARPSNTSSAKMLFGTMESATVTILSDGFVAQHIAFENSAPPPEPGAVGAQAVALLIAGDRAAFYYCKFLGAQDTLYDYIGRHYYLGCYIQGSIDFIFGNGRSLFQECELRSIATSFGAIAAHQRQSPKDDTGFSFDRCAVTGSGLLYLGRAWSPYARIVFSRTYIANIIFAEGWSDFGDPQRQSTTFFGQYECTGPGANLSHRAPWSKLLNEDDVLPYLSLDFVNGNEWLNTKPFSSTVENRTRT